MKITKTAIAEFYGLSYPTYLTYEKKATKGNNAMQNRVNAMKSYYAREQLAQSKAYKQLTDEDGQKMYLIYE